MTGPATAEGEGEPKEGRRPRPRGGQTSWWHTALAAAKREGPEATVDGINHMLVMCTFSNLTLLCPYFQLLYWKAVGRCCFVLVSTRSSSCVHLRLYHFAGFARVG
jgi:hypothetical protein